MPAVCRVGDLGVGICYQHDGPVRFTTVFCTGDPITSANGSPVVRIGDLGITSCGHITQATTGSSTVFGEGDQAVHRIGDRGIVLGGGTYVAVSGSPNVFAGDAPPGATSIIAPGVYSYQGQVMYDNSRAGQEAITREAAKYMPTEFDAPQEPVDQSFQTCDQFPEKIAMSSMSIKVSRHFTLSSCKNLPVDQRGLTANQIACNWAALCYSILDPIYDEFKFKFNSGFRTVVSGMGMTDHGLGCAADISCATTEQTLAMFKWIVRQGLPFSQIIYEVHNSAWVHVSFRGKTQSEATRIMCTLTGGPPYTHGGAMGANLPPAIRP